MEKGRAIGLFKPDDKAAQPKGIPVVKVVQKAKDPPWRTGQVNSVPPVMHNNNARDELK